MYQWESPVICVGFSLLSTWSFWRNFMDAAWRKSDSRPWYQLSTEAMNSFNVSKAGKPACLQ